MQRGSDECHLSVEVLLAQAQRAEHVGAHTVVEQEVGTCLARESCGRARQGGGGQDHTRDFSRKGDGGGWRPRDGGRKNAAEQCQKDATCCSFGRMMRQEIAHGATLETRTRAL